VRTPLEIREYAPSDFAFVRACYAQYLDEERSRVPVLGLPDGFAETYLPRLVQKVHDQQGAFLIASWEGAPCAYVAALPKPAQAWDATRGTVVMIMDLYVAPTHRRRGIGRQLFRAIEERFARAGFAWITLGTMAGNDEARAFYTAQGYADTYVFMGKPLSEPR